MKCWFALVLMLLAAACSPKEPTAQSAQSPEVVGAPKPGESDQTPPTAPTPQLSEGVTTSGITTLRFFSDVLESDQPTTPTFELSAPKLSMTEDNVWVVEQATAVAFGDDGSETTFTAGQGQFDDNTKTAMLSGGVNVTFGTQRVDMQDMTWSNETRTASSTNPVTVTDGETLLQAASMEYHADTKTLLLHGLTGTVSMKRAGNE